MVLLSSLSIGVPVNPINEHFLHYYIAYSTNNSYDIYQVEKKSSGNVDNHSSSIEFISAEKYNDQDVIIAAKRTYSHASGSIKKQNYIDLMNGGRVAHFKAVD